MKRLNDMLDNFLGYFFREVIREDPIYDTTGQHVIGWKKIYGPPIKKLVRTAKILLLIVCILAIVIIFIQQILQIPRWILILVGAGIFAIPIIWFLESISRHE